MRVLPALPPGVRAVLVVAATTLFMVLVAWATLIGPDEVFTGPGPQPASVTTGTQTCIPLPVTTNPDGSTTVQTPDDAADRPYCQPPDTTLQDARDMAARAEPPVWVKVVVWTLEVLLLAAVLGLLGFLAFVAVRSIRFRRGEEARSAVAFDVLSEPVRVVEEMVADAEAQDALLRDGEPRNAIVSAWHRFEVQGERAGVPRRASETSSEYAIRVLDLVAADGGSVNRLAELYREARFSDHPITEEHRAIALDALAVIRHGLGVRA
ncbi:DUF4129 domain-containing protein [Nocardioides oleivorans]|uniref:DUF4129 domain-containing protein n=1 Tax=Nocardioides oleivorans TaxID=273676 RepID=A0A4Q2RUZ6_9ACTN|nr:DUF4129 domain-containing protein [Nocardioides oleivorans]RYB92981.1 DUF4129 domain-containing protein [Nocardioides oleivorans]